jgi:hypothetical protein
MHQLFDGFEKFSLAIQQNSSALLDAYPTLQKLPEFMVPIVSYAKVVHKDKIKLYWMHYVRVKDAIRNGTPIDCFGVQMAQIQKEERINDEHAAYISGYVSHKQFYHLELCQKLVQIRHRRRYRQWSLEDFPMLQPKMIIIIDISSLKVHNS